MAVVSEVAQVVRGDLNDAVCNSAAEDAVIERTGEELREDGEDVEAHLSVVGSLEGSGFRVGLFFARVGATVGKKS